MRSVKRWRSVPMPARGPMMQRYQLGWPLQLERKRPAATQLQGRWRNHCDMVKTRINPLHFMWMERIARVLRPPFSTKAKNCHITTLTTQMLRLNWCQSLGQVRVRHARSSNMLTHAALRVVDPWLMPTARHMIVIAPRPLGIVALNQTLDGETAEEICKIFTEVVIAPDATQEAIDLFAAKKNLRLLTTGSMADPREVAKTVRQVSGGLLIQDKDNGHITAADLKVVTKRAPSEPKSPICCLHGMLQNT